MSLKINTTSKGGKKPHVHLLPIMVLVLFGLIALMGVVSADSVYCGAPHETILTGVVTGGVDVKMASDPWDASVSSTTRDPQYNWGNLSLIANPSNVDLRFARLYVVDYGGSMSANYTGRLSVDLYNVSSDSFEPLVDQQPLDLHYNNASAYYCKPDYNTSVDYPLVNLSRVTSDYLAVIDMTNYIKDMSTTDLKVRVTTWNDTGNFDARVKEIKLIYAWDEKGIRPVQYWVNEGHDPMTKYGGSGTTTFNTTWFNCTRVSGSGDYTNAYLWVNFLNNVGQGSGGYKWNGVAIAPTNVTYGKYGGLGNANLSGYSLTNDNELSYARGPNDWYKIIASVLSIEV